MKRQRQEFPASVKRAAWDRCKDANGIARCENCTARLSGANVHYDERRDGEFDHAQCDALLGEPTLENCQVLCKTCHGLKTTQDRKTIAKSNHVRDMARGIRQRQFRPIAGTKASGIAKPFRGDPYSRDSGRPLIERRKG